MYRSAIREAADQFRAKYWSDGSIPVDIELILERMGVNIVPQANLRRAVGIDACISADLKDLYIDLEYYLDERMTFRVRFSEAHELGHIILHGEIFNKHRENPPRSVLEWAQIIRNRIETGILEKEADEFASCFLVPEPELRNAYEKQFPLILETFSEKGYNLDSVEPDTLRSYLANPIHRIFQVSMDTIEIRLRKYRIVPND
jgi:Zn-dependent peptidase ImmA (M78 family)